MMSNTSLLLFQEIEKRHFKKHFLIAFKKSDIFLECSRKMNNKDVLRVEKDHIKNQLSCEELFVKIIVRLEPCSKATNYFVNFNRIFLK